MSDPRPYVASLVEESLGLVGGSTAGPDDKELLPEGFVQKAARILRSGEVPQGSDQATPFLEKEVLSLLPRIRDSWLERDGFFVSKARWPNASAFAVCLTHDVDNISRPFSHVWKIRGRFSKYDVLVARFGKSLYDNLGLVAAAEAGRGFRSSFYLMSAEYPLERVKHVAEKLRADGWEVGLHGDFGTHDSAEKMDSALARFKERLGFRPVGLREHYLKFDYAKSWEIMDAAGFDYDSTVGNTDRLGFRIGMATPFHPPGGDWRPMRLLELPLSLMDTTLWGYLKLQEQRGFDDCLRIMDEVERVEGLFTLLWHQEAVRMKGGRTYWKIIDRVKKRGVFTGSGAQIAAWWRARSVPLVKRGNLITMGGPPPQGLVLKIAIRDGRVPKVTSGSLQKLGEYEFLAKVEGAGFALEVS